MSSTLRNLIQSMLESDVSKRMGCTIDGASSAKKHKWFSGVDWEEVARKEIPPPWLPEVSNPFDAGNYDNYDKITISKEVPTEKDNSLFKDF